MFLLQKQEILEKNFYRLATPKVRGHSLHEIYDKTPFYGKKLGVIQTVLEKVNEILEYSKKKGIHRKKKVEIY